jgi:MinD-like ATPase involved in chromosome partitioning or flagellar assembly
MVRETKEREVGQIVGTVSRNYLSIALDIMGIVQYDRILSKSINNMGTFLTERRDSIVNVDFYDIANNIIKNSQNQTQPSPSPLDSNLPVSKV